MNGLNILAENKKILKKLKPYKMADLGVFNSLENLERLNVQSREKSFKSSKQSVRLNTLQAKKVRLEEKKRELENQLKEKKQRVKNLQNLDGNLDKITDENKDSLLNIEEIRLVDLLQTYRLAGSTLESVHDNVATLRLDTCYCGKYNQPFYAELQMNEDKFSLKRHTLPKFIPEEVMRETLDCGLKEFCGYIHSYLRPYLARREEAFLTQAKFEAAIDGEICSSPSFDYIEIGLKENEIGMTGIKLLYEDIRSADPTLVQVMMDQSEGSRVEEDLEETVESLKRDLEQRPLSEVFANHFLTTQDRS